MTELLETIAAGYATDEPTISLGAAVVADEAHAQVQVRLPLAMMNRHGLIAGATGTGKTKTLQLMAEQLSRAGVPVFMADIKGDLSGLAVPGTANKHIDKRAASVGQTWQPTAFPVEFLSLGGIGSGVPIRATITDFGPTLMSKVLRLNRTQASSLGLIFHYADKHGLELFDLQDLRAVIAFLISDEGKDELKGLGALSPATAGVILRQLIVLEDQGAEAFFGEPQFDSHDLLRTAADGKGIISCLELPALQDRPTVFSTFLMWLLADLFADLPEVGDLDKPKLVFFFDEAHLLFEDASPEFLDAIEQTVRLIRSKGVGVFFVTQTPRDVPESVLGQLGNRVQHALRAFTPNDAKALKATVQTFPRSDYDLEELLTSLGIGEAVVTVLSERGAPTPVAWTRMMAPTASMDPAPQERVEQLVAASPLGGKYGERQDRLSAFERLNQEEAEAATDTGGAASSADAEPGTAAANTDAAAAAPPGAAAPAPAQVPVPAPASVPDSAPARPMTAAEKAKARLAGNSGVQTDKPVATPQSAGSGESAAQKAKRRAGVKEQKEEPSLIDEVKDSGAVRSFMRSMGTVLGREISRSLFGTSRRRRRRR